MCIPLPDFSTSEFTFTIPRSPCSVKCVGTLKLSEKCSAPARIKGNASGMGYQHYCSLGSLLSLRIFLWPAVNTFRKQGHLPSNASEAMLSLCVPGYVHVWWAGGHSVCVMPCRRDLHVWPLFRLLQNVQQAGINLPGGYEAPDGHVREWPLSRLFIRRVRSPAWRHWCRKACSLAEWTLAWGIRRPLAILAVKTGACDSTSGSLRFLSCKMKSLD